MSFPSQLVLFSRQKLGVKGDAAKFYTDAEIKTACDKAVEIAAEGVASFYSDVGVHFDGRFSYLHENIGQLHSGD